MLIGVDPGHGGHKDGAWSPSRLTREADLTLAVGRCIRSWDPKIYLTRDSDKWIEYHDRSIAAEKAGVGFMVCLHFDSTPWAPQSHGCHAYYAKDSIAGEQVARFAVQHAPDVLRGGKIVCAHDNPDTREDDWKGHAQYLCEVYKCPTLLLEFGYLSNPNDLKYLIRTDGIEDCAALVLQCTEFAEQLIGESRAAHNPSFIDPLSNL